MSRGALCNKCFLDAVYLSWMTQSFSKFYFFDLVSSIRKLTGTLHVGIGSFIDKVLLPYTDTSYQG